MIDALAPAVLAGLVGRCAPHVGPVTMAAVVRYESGGHPYALGDNTARRSYAFATAAEAERTARALLARHHSIDMGLAQVNSVHLGERGVDLAALFDPCANVAIGSAILRADYLRAARAYGPGQLALARALSAYNTGNFLAGARYAQAVIALARPHLRTTEALVPVRPAAVARLLDGPIVIDADRLPEQPAGAADGPIVIEEPRAAQVGGIVQ